MFNLNKKSNTEVEDLEPQQYANLYYKEDVPLADVRKNILRKFVYYAAAIIIFFIVLGFSVKFPTQLSYPFIIKSNQKEEIYRYPTNVYIISTYVNPGQKVKQGDYLVKITSPEISELITQFNAAQKFSEQFQSYENISIEKQTEILRLNNQKLEVELTKTQKDLNYLEQSWSSAYTKLTYDYEQAKKFFSINKRLFENGTISQWELDIYKAKEVNALNELEKAQADYNTQKNTLQSRMQEIKADIQRNEQEILKIAIDKDSRDVQIKNELDLIKSKITQTYGKFLISEEGLIILSPMDGQVSYLFTGEKEVAAGAILLKIFSGASQLYALSDIPSQQIGRIKKNNKVVLKVASFPHYQWGVMEGYIKYLSLTPDEKGNFSCEVQITNYGHLRKFLQIGMTGTATIILEEKTFMAYIFEGFKKTYYNLVE